MYISKRLNQLLNSSDAICFDDSSRIVLFSDCHRGDNSWADDFSHNQCLFFHALSYYYDKNFTYIELGDGDELWKNSNFSSIRYAHSDIFWLLQKFHMEGRLYMMFGNHDIIKRDKRFVQNRLYKYYNIRMKKYMPLFENIKVREGLVLKYDKKSYKILVVHGHQGDLFNDLLWPVSRFLVRHIWRQLELLGIKSFTSPARNYIKATIIEKNIIDWTKSTNHMVIAGHTHNPAFPSSGNFLYFNTGSCIHPRCITGIEIENGSISLIKWSIKPGSDGTLCISKDYIEGPKKLTFFFERV